jgi:DNA-binding response OmpR family regulator
MKKYHPLHARRQGEGKVRRPRGAVANRSANVVVDWERREIRHNSGRHCKLSVCETTLLAYLARKVGTPVSRDEILSQVWHLDPRRTVTRTIDMHISTLRRKLDEDSSKSSVLVTVYRVGYMLHRSAISCDDVPLASNEGWSNPCVATPGLGSFLCRK